MYCPVSWLFFSQQYILESFTDQLMKNFLNHFNDCIDYHCMDICAIIYWSNLLLNKYLYCFYSFIITINAAIAYVISYMAENNCWINSLETELLSQMAGILIILINTSAFHKCLTIYMISMILGEFLFLHTVTNTLVCFKTFLFLSK